MTTLVLAMLIMLIPVTEEGATFSDGICWEADGTEGIAMLDGQCMTPADYDIIYGYDNLASTASLQDPNRSIADVYNMTPADDPASDRPIGAGLVPEGEERSFKERVKAAHLPLAE